MAAEEVSSTMTTTLFNNQHFSQAIRLQEEEERCQNILVGRMIDNYLREEKDLILHPDPIAERAPKLALLD